MKGIRNCGVTEAGAIMILALLGIVAGSSAGELAEREALGAKVIEIDGLAEASAPEEEARALKAGDYVAIGEELTVHGGSTVTLAMADRTVREFTGPTTLRIEPGREVTGGKTLANLTAAVADMLFRPEQRASETVMATRYITGKNDRKTSVPILIYPAPGASLMDPPKAFEWVRVQGVRLYQVSVYSTKDLLWQETTSAARATNTAPACDFPPGETYYWIAEALVGDTTLRPEAADFTILDADARSGLVSALEATDSSVADPRMAMLLKARLCLDNQVIDKAMEIVDQYMEREAPDRTAYVLQGEISERMGLTEDAARYYKKALTMPSGR